MENIDGEGREVGTHCHAARSGMVTDPHIHPYDAATVHEAANLRLYQVRNTKFETCGVNSAACSLAICQ